MAFTLALEGCASVAQGPAFSQARAQTQPADKAVVYVFRKYAEPTAWGATVHFGKSEVATLNQGGFTWAYVSPGRLTVRAVWAGLSGQKDSNVEISVQPGKTYYLELLGVSRVTGYIAGMIYTTMGSGLNELSGAAAEPTIAQCCKFQKPASINY